MKKILAVMCLLATMFVARMEGTTTCVFNTVGTTMTLTGSCTTDATIFVPNGFTLDGAGFTITAIDPPGGHFLGAVIKNDGGTTAHVKNVKVMTSGLANVCDGGADRLRGILFESAGGSIVNTQVVNVNQGQSGCQEGNGIEVRNLPFDDTTDNDVLVEIRDNTVMGYQKNGITANGSVFATVTDNTVIGAGPIDYIAQNGIQIGFGARAVVSGNVVLRNDYTPTSFVACGILYFQADGVRAHENFLSRNEFNFCNFGQKGGGNPAS